MGGGGRIRERGPYRSLYFMSQVFSGSGKTISVELLDKLLLTDTFILGLLSLFFSFFEGGPAPFDTARDFYCDNDRKKTILFISLSFPWQNIFLTDNGTVKLGDFGSACLVSR